ncbi:MAG: dethiobiotin synthase [Mariprofundus sp.]|nr:dethiobiotin synthase [Mariprofundus sp.]
MASKHIFITATDTDAGKTWVSTALIRGLLAQGAKAKALKPIACGCDANGRNDDIDLLLKAQHLSQISAINRYCFNLPAAPSQAATAEVGASEADSSEAGFSETACSEKQAIDPAALVQWCQQQSADVDYCLIEGIGGLMTPLTNTWLVCDWIDAMPEYDVWLVLNCKLGAINHTLLTLVKLKQMQRSPKRIFFNATSPAQNDRIPSTHQAISPFLPADCIIDCLPFGSHPVYT